MILSLNVPYTLIGAQLTSLIVAISHDKMKNEKGSSKLQNVAFYVATDHTARSSMKVVYMGLSALDTMFHMQIDDVITSYWVIILKLTSHCDEKNNW